MTEQKFKRDGNNIYTTIEIEFTDAILGTKKEVKTLTKSVLVAVPAGSQPGAKLRLKGQGLMVDNHAGDLIVEIAVRIPQHVSDSQREILSKWDSLDS